MMLPPLVRAAHLQNAAVALVEFDEIIGLQAHVIEFEERQFLVAFEPHLDGVHRQHAIDRKMPPDLAEKIDVVEAHQPVGVIGHDSVFAALAEVEEFGKDALDPLLVGLDRLERKHLAAFVLPGGIANPRRAAAHQRDRLAAGLLQQAQQHDLHQRADMERGRRAVEPDIGDEFPGCGLSVEPGEIRALMDVAARDQRGQELGRGTVIVGHD